MPRTRGNGSVVGQVITPGGSGVVAAQDATQYILSGQWPDTKYAATSGASVTISSIVVTDSGYNNLDDTAAATSNSYIRILGSGFSSTANVFLNGAMVPKANITFVSSSELRARLPVSNTGNYAISVFNSNTAGALHSNTFIISTMPQWLTSATLANVTSNTVFSNTFSATSDSNVTYANTTILPTGFNLLSNGYYYGNISVGVATTYSFDIKATDAENQDTTRTFSLTTSITPPSTLLAGGTAGQPSGGSYASSYLDSFDRRDTDAFDNSLNADNACYHSANNPGNVTFQFNFSSAKTLTNYRFLSRYPDNDWKPSTWTLEGSNNNSTWTTIDSRSNQALLIPNSQSISPSTEIAAGRYLDYAVASPGSYQYYRFIITHKLNNTQNGTSSLATDYLVIGELMLYGY